MLDPELKAELVEEALEGLVGAEQALMGLESSPSSQRLNDALRPIHTLKGNAGFFEMDSVVQLCHALEDHLQPYRQAGDPPPNSLTLALNTVDTLRALLAETLAAAPTELLQALSSTPALPKQASPPCSPPLDEAPTGPLASQRTLRVGLDRLDRMLEVVGELAVSRAQGLDSRPELPELEAFTKDSGDALFQELQEQVLRLRLVSLEGQLTRLQRLVHDLAAQTQKQCRLLLDMEGVEVDTSIVESLHDPLVHLLRNAVDHGIEPPATRQSKGKDPTGTITISARVGVSWVEISLSDDGAGIDEVKVRQQFARPQGEQEMDLSLLDLLCRPGLSTQETPSTISGRGLGMEVVRRNIQAAGGKLELHAQAGLGSTFTIRVPITLSTREGLSVRAGGELFILPISMIESCQQISADSAGRSEGLLAGRRGMIALVPLAHLLDLEAQTHPSLGVVVALDQEQFLILVDEILGEVQVIAKPIPTWMGPPEGVSGCAVLPSGELGVVLDPRALIRNKTRQGQTLKNQLKRSTA